MDFDEQATDIIMTMMRSVFEGGEKSVIEVQQPQYFSTFTICRLGFRLLKQIIKGNSINRLWLSSRREIEFLERLVSA